MSRFVEVPSAGERVVCVLRAAEEGPRAASIAGWAGALADGLGVPLDLVGVAEVFSPVGVTAVPGVPIASVPELADVHEPHLDLSAVAERAGVRPASTRELPGPVAGTLEELAQASSTALIVVGDDGESALWSAITGAPTRRAANDLPAPLVLVPEGARGRGDAPWRIAAGILDETHLQPVLSLAAALAERLGGDLTLLVAEDGRDSVTERAGTILPAGARMRVESLAGDAAEGCNELLERGEADMLVVAPPERGLLASAVLGSVFHAIAAGGHGPIVVAPTGGADD